MAIPTNYTVETFSDYLMTGVALGAAVEFSWLDTVPQLAPTAASDIIGFGSIRIGDGQFITTQTQLSATTINVVPLAFNIPSGTVITYYGTGPESGAGQTRTTTGTKSVGDMTIDLTTGLTTTPFGKGRFYNIAPTRIRNPIWAAITEETLSKLGETDITTITGAAAIRKLRLFGRREVWRMAMQQLAADFDYENVHRRDVYIHAKEAFLFEDARINNLYPDANEGMGGSSSILYPTERAKINIRW